MFFSPFCPFHSSASPSLGHSLFANPRSIRTPAPIHFYPILTAPPKYITPKRKRSNITLNGKTISRFAHSSKGKYLESPIFVPEFYEIFLSGIAVKIGKQPSFSGNEKRGVVRWPFSPASLWFLRNGLVARAHIGSARLG